MKITTIGLDLAKSVFHVVCFDEKHQEVSKRMLRRSQVREYFAQREPCRVAMEACAGAHCWGRELEKLGHTVKLIPPQFVKPYVKGNKNDYNDARAIAEAATRPGMRFVSIKTVEQQDIQALHRLREQRVKERTALCNQLRALVAEYGIVMNKGVASVRRGIPLLLGDAENALSTAFRALLARGYEQLIEIEAHIDYYTDQVDAHSRQNASVRRLQTLPGYGPIVASVFASVVGDGSAFKRGRDVSASLGLVPRQHSSGGKDVTPAKRGKGRPHEEHEDKTPEQRHQSMTWAQRLKRVFNIDVSVCPKCGGEARVIASIEDQQIIDKILAHLMKKGALPPPPELLPATRASPDSDWFT